MRCAYYDGCASVYAPGDLGEEKDLPVIFYIHGYLLTPLSTNFSLIIFISLQGAGIPRASSPRPMVTISSAKRGGGAVAVFIQYRLGVFIFLPGEMVKEGGALNAGLCKCP